MKAHDVLADSIRNPEPPLDVVAPAQPRPTGATLRQRAVWLLSRAWFWPTVVTGAFGAFRLGRPELWRDELRSWSAASRSLGELFHLLGNTDAAVALYYLMLHFWMQVFGESPMSLRLPSLLAMAGAAACVSLIGQRLYDRKVGIAGGLVFAFIPAVSRFAQEVRPYAITLLLTGVSTLLFLRAIERPARGRWLGYGLSLTGVALAQVVAVPVIAAHALGLVIWKRHDRRIHWSWLIAVGVGLALAAPVILISVSQYGHQVGELPDATLRELTTLPPRLFASGAVAGVVVGAALFAFGRSLRSAIFLAGWALLPIIIVWVVSNLGESYWMTRYLLPTLPAFALLAGAAVMTIANVRVAALAIAAVAMLGVQDQAAIRWQGSHDQWNYPEYAHQPLLYSDAAKIIEENLRPGDAVAYTARSDYWLLDVGLAYNLRGKPQPRDAFVDQTAVHRGDFWPTECTDLARCLDDAPRVWLVSASVKYGPDGLDDLEPAKQDVLLTRYVVEHKYFVSGIAVVLLERDPDVP